jgi:hypothetical protein
MIAVNIYTLGEKRWQRLQSLLGNGGVLQSLSLLPKSSTLIDLEGDSGIAANEVGMVPELEDLMAAA